MSKQEIRELGRMGVGGTRGPVRHLVLRGGLSVAQSSVGHPGGHRRPKAKCSILGRSKPQAGKYGGFRRVAGVKEGLPALAGQHSSWWRRRQVSEGFFFPGRCQRCSG